MMKKGPTIWADYPDPDVIRVEDTYYMVSTTMHMMPGCVILRSYDLVNWEVATHVYDVLEGTPDQRLEGDGHIYGRGMWAASLRQHKGRFYICFVCNDTTKTYLYTADEITGPWKRQYIKGFYHDCSLLFDEDDRVYLVYGNNEIHLTELEADLSGPKQGGIDRIILREQEPFHLGYEGAHFYKINGKYYIFLIHILKSGNQRRTQACFVADSLEGEFVGKEVFDEDMGYHNSGIAQGGIVDTPDGKWYAMLFQDHGAVGRVPVLVQVEWENNWPVFCGGQNEPTYLECKSTRPDYAYKPLVGSDDFTYEKRAGGKVYLKDIWQWNHIPADDLWSVTDYVGTYRIQSGKLSNNVVHAVNTLTQRTVGPTCQAIVTLDGKGLKDGDYAGLCLLIGTYGLIGLTREEGQYYLVMIAKESKDKSIFEKLIDNKPGTEYARIPLHTSCVTLRADCDFEENKDEVMFYYQEGDVWTRIGITHKMEYKLDHFMGARFGLFLYATKEIGGVAEFSEFVYLV
jgi:beta-xylosidase